MFGRRGGRVSRLRTRASRTSSRAKASNRRDTLALHAKLDELLRVDYAARSELTQLDEQEPEVIARHRDEQLRKTNREPDAARWRLT